MKMEAGLFEVKGFAYVVWKNVMVLLSEVEFLIIIVVVFFFCCGFDYYGRVFPFNH